MSAPFFTSFFSTFFGTTFFLLPPSRAANGFDDKTDIFSSGGYYRGQRRGVTEQCERTQECYTQGKGRGDEEEDRNAQLEMGEAISLSNPPLRERVTNREVADGCHAGVVWERRGTHACRRVARCGSGVER